MSNNIFYFQSNLQFDACNSVSSLKIWSEFFWYYHIGRFLNFCQYAFHQVIETKRWLKVHAKCVLLFFYYHCYQTPCHSKSRRFLWFLLQINPFVCFRLQLSYVLFVFSRFWFIRRVHNSNSIFLFYEYVDNILMSFFFDQQNQILSVILWCQWKNVFGGFGTLISHWLLFLRYFNMNEFVFPFWFRISTNGFLLIPMIHLAS